MYSGIKLGIATLALLMLCAGCTTIHHFDSSTLDVKSLPDLMAEPDQWKQIGHKLEGGGEVVIFAPKGQSIPLKLTLDIPIVNLLPGDNRIVFNRDAYILFSGKGPKISPDGQRWADILDVDAMEVLFSFSKGNISMGFGASKEDGTFMAIGMETK